MKKLLLLICILLSADRLFAQNGLESILVEKYYISDVNDTTANLDGGVSDFSIKDKCLIYFN